MSYTMMDSASTAPTGPQRRPVLHRFVRDSASPVSTGLSEGWSCIVCETLGAAGVDRTQRRLVLWTVAGSDRTSTRTSITVCHKYLYIVLQLFVYVCVSVAIWIQTGFLQTPSVT